jgi:chromosome segregation ATPase
MQQAAQQLKVLQTELEETTKKFRIEELARQQDLSVLRTQQQQSTQAQGRLESTIAALRQANTELTLAAGNERQGLQQKLESLEGQLAQQAQDFAAQQRALQATYKQQLATQVSQVESAVVGTLQQVNTKIDTLSRALSQAEQQLVEQAQFVKSAVGKGKEQAALIAALQAAAAEGDKQKAAELTAAAVKQDELQKKIAAVQQNFTRIEQQLSGQRLELNVRDERVAALENALAQQTSKGSQEALSLQQQLKEARAEKDGVDQEIVKQASTLVSYKTQVQQLQEQLTSMTALEAANKSYEQTQADLMQRMKAAVDSAEKQHGDDEMLRSELTALQKQLQDVQQLRQQLAAAKQAQETAQQTVQVSENQRSALAADAQAAAQRMSDLSAQLELLRKSNGEAQATHAQEQQQLRATIAGLQKDLEAQQQRMAEENAKALAQTQKQRAEQDAAYEQQRAALEKSLAIAQQAFKDQQGVVEKQLAAGAQKDAAIQTLTTLNTSLEEQKTELAQQAKDREALAAQLQQAQDAAQKTEAQMQQTAQALDKARSSADDLVQQLRAEKAQGGKRVSEFEQELAVAQGAIESTQRELKAQKDLLSASSKQTEVLTAQNEALQKAQQQSHQKHQKELEKAMQQLQAQVSGNAALQAQLATLNTKLKQFEALQATLDITEKEKVAAQQALLAADAKQRELQVKLDEQSAGIARLQDELRQKEELASANKRLSKQVDDYEQRFKASVVTARKLSEDQKSQQELALAQGLARRELLDEQLISFLSLKTSLGQLLGQINQAVGRESVQLMLKHLAKFFEVDIGQPADQQAFYKALYSFMASDPHGVIIVDEMLLEKLKDYLNAKEGSALGARKSGFSVFTAEYYLNLDEFKQLLISIIAWNIPFGMEQLYKENFRGRLQGGAIPLHSIGDTY